MALLNSLRWPLTLALVALAGCGTLNEAEVDEEIPEETGAVEGSLTGALPTGTKIQAIYATYLRRGPGSNYSAIAVVPRGEIVTVASTSNNNGYYYVNFRGTYGYVYGPYYRLAPTTPTTEPTTPTTPTPTTPTGTAANLRADVNRDGVVSAADTADEEGEDSWSASRGAIFLANIDDDQRTCRSTDSQGYALPDAELARCNDANDEIVNGSSDLLDLARMRVIAWTSAPADAVGTLSVSATAATKVRLFRSNGTTFTAFKPESDVLSSAELSSGVELAIEAKDIVRNAALWDGYATVTLRVRSTSAAVDSTDSVKLRVSPVMLFHHKTPVQALYASNVSGDTDSANFRSALQSILTSQGISTPLQSLPTNDQWAQDYFETGYASMPSANGSQQVMRVAFRSANVQGQRNGYYPLRQSGRLVFTHMRGPDVAGVQQVDLSYDTTGQTDSLNSYGNTETIPPYTYNGVSYPFGRILRGSVSNFAPDPSVSRMFADQKIQPPLTVDTSWLLVGHVDEIFSFIPAPTPRGWKLLVNDPTLARQMLQSYANQGYGSTRMFVGQYWYNDYGQQYSATVTINEVLNDTEVMSESAKAAAEVDAQLAIVKAATGVTESEIIRVPFLHYPYSGYSLAYQPGTVNGVSLNASTFISPDPFGPVIGGRDIFKAQLEQALAPEGATVRWVDDWNLFHRNMGEVHCGSNATRAIPSAKWWESGR